VSVCKAPYGPEVTHGRCESSESVQQATKNSSVAAMDSAVTKIVLKLLRYTAGGEEGGEMKTMKKKNRKQKDRYIP